MNSYSPLDDILSDENDSFFEEPKLQKRSSITNTPEKTDNTNNENMDNKKLDDWLGLNTKTTGSIKSPTKLTKKISFNDELNIFDDVGLNKKKPLTDLKLDKPRSVGGTGNKPNINIFDDIFDVNTNKDQKNSSSIPEGRRSSRRLSAGLIDPLETITIDNPIVKIPDNLDASKLKPIQIKSSHNIKQVLPDWMNDSIKLNKSEEIISKKIDEDEKQNSIIIAPSTTDFQNTLVALQQQESQVLMALQFKKYEENILSIQNKQQEILTKQEQKFNEIMEKNLIKQQMLENNVRLQQERINNFVQSLLSYSVQFGNTEQFIDKKSSNDENSRQCDSMIESLRERQRQELYLLEESYKKRITFLEETLTNFEIRSKENSQKHSEHFENKINDINRIHNEEIENYKKRIENLEQQHEDQMRFLRDNHLKIIDEIKFEQTNLIDTIKNSKESERNLFSKSLTYSEKLDKNIEILNTNSKAIHEIKKEMERDFGILMKTKEENLKAKEEEINMMKIALEKSRETAEQERTYLLSLVRSLETKIAEQFQNEREDRWAFQQATSILAAKSTALERETEFNRKVLNKERQIINKMKDDILKEQEEFITKMNDEKLHLEEEKRKLEIEKDLAININRSQMEYELKITKESKKRSENELQNLLKRRVEADTLIELLSTKEQQLIIKEKQLNDAIENLKKKEQECNAITNDANNLKKLCNSKRKSLDEQAASLLRKEQKIRNQKMTISKERLALITAFRQMKKCGLCVAECPDDINYLFQNTQNFDCFKFEGGQSTDQNNFQDDNTTEITDHL